jgi:shikimate dehydrogenase
MFFTAYCSLLTCFVMLNASTQFIAIIGDPIEHSMTPVIQNAALRELGVNVANVAFRVKPKNLREAVTGARALKILGLMVTIPHKVAIMQYLDEVDAFGKMMGSVNLVHFHPERGAVGYNTDGYGAARSLSEEDVDLKDSHVVLLGGGGAARCLAQKLCLEGAAQLTILNRTLSRAEEIAAETKRNTDVQPAVTELNEENLRRVLPEANLLVNATSVGMYPNENETPVPADALHADLVVFDIVYNPLETVLLRDARRAGAKTVDGVGMLVYTNELAVQTCTGLTPNVQTMRRVCMEELQKKMKQSHEMEG